MVYAHPSDSIYQNKIFQYEIDYPDLILRRIERTRTPPERAERGIFVKIKVFLVNNSALVYNLYKIRKQLTTQQADSLSPLDPTDPYFAYFAGALPPEQQYAWALWEALILEMHTAAIATESEFLLLAPFGSTENRRDRFLQNRWIQYDEQGDFIIQEGIRHEIELERYNRLIADITARPGIPLMLLTGDYEIHKYDSHFNAAGDFAMAHDIVNYLLEWEPFLNMIEESE